MTKKILIINGPNLNLLGERERLKYGKTTLEDLKKNCESHAKSINFNIEFFQSNIEGEIVTAIQEAKGIFDAIIINAAGYTHTSVAILDALLAVKLPTIEVHITNIYNREDFRKKSLISRAANGIICGFGINGYIMALNSIKKIIDEKK
jgi:3-dehydroquinate dehydratase-2